MKIKMNFCKNKYLNYTSIILMISTLIVLIYSASTKDLSEFSKTSGVLILLQFFSFSIGGFFGFLFGFPSHNNSEFKDQYLRNNSLKEITSWLTKIIVGITLIELKNIFSHLEIFITNLSIVLNGDNSHIAVISCIVGIFFVLGFIVLYILSVTTIFEELVKNDKNIDFILNHNSMNPSELNIENIFNDDESDINELEKKEIINYVSKNGFINIDSIISKRIGKFFVSIKEWNLASKGYKNAYDKNQEDEKYSLLNYCYIQSKYLKNFDKSNEELKKMIEHNQSFAPAYYNLACNYIREYLEFGEDNNSEYIKKLKEKAETHLIQAFKKNKGLYSEALKDSELSILDIKKIFIKSKN